MAKPTIKKHPHPAQSSNEANFEFSSENGGGLLTLTVREDGKLIVDVFRCDDTVVVRAPAANLDETVHGGPMNEPTPKV